MGKRPFGGAPYELNPILLGKGQQRTENYPKINPRGKVPALSVALQGGFQKKTDAE
jgi:glutathione S-transferase